MTYTTTNGEVRITDPANLRGFFDAAEVAATSAAMKAAALAADAAGAVTGGIASGPVTAASQGLTQTLLNKSGTAGYKRHMLTGKDADKVTQIILNANTSVTFRSPSGVSETVTRNV